MAKNTTKTINAGEIITPDQLKQEIESAARVFKDEKLVPVSIPQSYKKFIGETLPISINGATIVLPVDGSKQEIPETFADHLRDYLNNLTV